MSFLLIYSAVVSGRHSICCFPHCSHMFLTRREPGVPLSLFRPYPLPFSPPFLLYCSLPFLFSSISFSLIYICCSLGRHSICCFPCCSHMFLTRREPGVLLSLFRPYPLPFSPPFLLYCSLITLPFLHVFFIDLYISAVVSGEAFYLLFSLLYVSDPQGTWNALVSFPTLSSSLFSSFSSILFLTLPFLLYLFH